MDGAPHEQRMHFVVEGRVQGVGFRAATRRRADALGLRGFVQNLADGTVELEAEGEPHALTQLAAWLERGAPLARVDRVRQSTRQALGSERGFHVRR